MSILFFVILCFRKAVKEISSELHDNLSFLFNETETESKGSPRGTTGTRDGPRRGLEGATPSGRLRAPCPLSAPIFAYKLPLDLKIVGRALFSTIRNPKPPPFQNPNLRVLESYSSTLSKEEIVIGGILITMPASEVMRE